MANQSPDRREILSMLGKIAALSQIPGFSRWVCFAEHPHQQSLHTRPPAYHPLFFSPAEYNTVDIVTEHIIPKDATAGAHEAGVAEFIDFMVSHDPELQYPFRTGLGWLDAFAMEKKGARFLALASNDREELLRKLAYRAEQSPTEIQGQEFFALIRKYTVLGYYTSRVGLEELDYPGLRVYSTSPECPHKDDPEHKHLGRSQL
jgi:gluconate 2-dehydrogenase gamma chain